MITKKISKWISRTQKQAATFQRSNKKAPTRTPDKKAQKQPDKKKAQEKISKDDESVTKVVPKKKVQSSRYTSPVKNLPPSRTNPQKKKAKSVFLKKAPLNSAPN